VPDTQGIPVIEFDRLLKMAPGAAPSAIETRSRHPGEVQSRLKPPVFNSVGWLLPANSAKKDDIRPEFEVEFQLPAGWDHFVEVSGFNQARKAFFFFDACTGVKQETTI